MFTIWTNGKLWAPTTKRRQVVPKLCETSKSNKNVGHFYFSPKWHICNVAIFQIARFIGNNCYFCVAFKIIWADWISKYSLAILNHWGTSKCIAIICCFVVDTLWMLLTQLTNWHSAQHKIHMTHVHSMFCYSRINCKIEIKVFRVNNQIWSRIAWRCRKWNYRSTFLSHKNYKSR